MTRGTYTPWQPTPPPNGGQSAPPLLEYKTKVGQTTHGQPIELTATELAGGQMVFSLTKHAANQRDDTITIFHLPMSVMDQIHASVDMIKRLKK